MLFASDFFFDFYVKAMVIIDVDNERKYACVCVLLISIFNEENDKFYLSGVLELNSFYLYVI